MSSIGKVVGTIAGLLYGGIIWAGAGFLVGHVYDLLAELIVGRRGRGAQSHTQEVFFNTTFTVMGHLAKADGRVSESEIQAAENVMREMRLGAERRAEARDLFRRGKAPDFDLDGAIRNFNEACGRRLNLKVMFLQIQFSAVWADGDFSEAERLILVRIARALSIPDQLFHQIEAMVGAFARRASSGDWQSQGRRTGQTQAAELQQSYAILGVSAHDDDDQIKRAYRKLMNQHHPDKLVAKGLPKDMMEVATRRAAEIQNAYDVVKQARAAS